MQEQKLLFELTHTNNERDLYNTIYNDMMEYNSKVEHAYDDYTGIFENFLLTYKQNLIFLQQLKEQELQLLNANSYLTLNDKQFDFNAGGNFNQTGGYTTPTSGSNGQWASGQNYFGLALEAAKAGNLAQAKQYLSLREAKVADTGINYGTSSQEALKQVMNAYNGADYVISNGTTYTKQNGTWSPVKFASGLDKGAVIGTGLAQLDGSPDNPEYVLTNDQTSTLVDNYETLSKMANSNELVYNTTGTGADEIVDSTGTGAINITGTVTNVIDGINALINQFNSLLTLSGGIYTHTQNTANSTDRLAFISNNIETILQVLDSSYTSLKELAENDVNQDADFYARLIDYLNKMQEDMLARQNNLIEVLNGLGHKLDADFGNDQQIVSLIQQAIQSLQDFAAQIQQSLQQAMQQQAQKQAVQTYAGYAGGGGGGGGDSYGLSYNRGGKNATSAYMEEINYVSGDDAKVDTAHSAANKQVDFSLAWHTAKDQGASQDVLNAIEAERDAKVAEQGYDPNPDWKENIIHYASGLEKGPVTETGLAMLDGSDEEPEYVITDEQATAITRNYDALTRMATDNASTYSVEGTGENGNVVENGTGSINITGSVATVLEGLNALINQFNSLLSLQGGIFFNTQSTSNNTDKLPFISNNVEYILQALSQGYDNLNALISNDVSQDQEFYMQVLEALRNLYELLNSNLPEIRSAIGELNANTQREIEALQGIATRMEGLSQSVTQAISSARQASTQVSASKYSGGGGGGGGSGSGTSYDFSSKSATSVYLEEIGGVSGDSSKVGVAHSAANNNVDYSQAWANAKASGASQSVLNAIESERNAKVQSKYGGKDPNPNWKENVKAYATGLEAGPVTETGLAMLHGTPDEPEHVLTDDQAHNLLTRLAESPADNSSATYTATGTNDGMVGANGVGSINIQGTVATTLEGLNAIINQFNSLLSLQGGIFFNTQITANNTDKLAFISNNVEYILQAISQSSSNMKELIDINIENNNGMIAKLEEAFNNMQDILKNLSNDIINNLQTNLKDGFGKNDTNFGEQIKYAGETVSKLDQLSSSVGSYQSMLGGSSSSTSFSGGGGGGGGGSSDSGGFWENITSERLAATEAKVFRDSVSGRYVTTGPDGKYMSVSKQMGEEMYANRTSGTKGSFTVAKESGKGGTQYTKKDSSDDSRSSISSSGISILRTDGGKADGLLSGPVDYTGLTMLHGTPTAPEYVLNSDQAYTLLRNMATTRMPQYERVASVDSGTSYVLNGDIILENCNDPAKFWDEVTAAMSNRTNVTKNR